MSFLSILKLKCPRCEKGDMFESGSAFFSLNIKMHKECTVCKENYFKEPGFYFGAMFISYIVSGLLSLLIVGLMIIVLKMNWLLALFVLFVILAISYIYLYKVSRAIWLNFFVKKK
ncbi:MAG: DUF983 domain-containing protein [Saprospiraceae bacterium]|nr:DUF983 domain-containing protein [Saprospiraceae bacterium]